MAAEEELAHENVWTVVLDDALRHPHVFDVFNLTDMHGPSKLRQLSEAMLCSICEHFDIDMGNIKGRRKASYLSLLGEFLESCDCHHSPCFDWPALLLRLIVVCPYLTVFWADSCNLHVGLLFCPLQALIWQKWFSTRSWLIMAGLITAWGYSFNLIETNAWKPNIIDCRSNQKFWWNKALRSSFCRWFPSGQKGMKIWQVAETYITCRWDDMFVFK